MKKIMFFFLKKIPEIVEHDVWACANISGENEDTWVPFWVAMATLNVGFLQNKR